MKIKPNARNMALNPLREALTAGRSDMVMRGGSRVASVAPAGLQGPLECRLPTAEAVGYYGPSRRDFSQMRSFLAQQMFHGRDDFLFHVGIVALDGAPHPALLVEQDKELAMDEEVSLVLALLRLLLDRGQFHAIHGDSSNALLAAGEKGPAREVSLEALAKALEDLR